MPELEDAFSTLLKRQATDEEIQHLYRVRDALGIRPNDALWQVLIALQYYQHQYERFPAEISKACEAVLAKLNETANKAAHAAAEEAKRDLAQAVGTAVSAASRGASWKEIARWCLISVVTLAFLAGGGVWAGSQLGSRAAQEESRQRGAWAESAEGRLAYELARIGSLRTILRCEGPGWQLHNGKCFPQPFNATVYGWDVPGSTAAR
jgi:hypothetical protein